MAGESLKEYVAKFNMVALEILGVDTNIKKHAFIQGLCSGPFFDSLIMKEPKDLGDMLQRIKPYIHLEEARTARDEEVEKGRGKIDKQHERENKREHVPSSKGYTQPGKAKYDNRPREFNHFPSREGVFTAIREP